MNESILKALMRLFAIIANVEKDGVSTSSRSIVESYLREQLSTDLVEEYLQLFDEYLAVHHGDISDRSSRKGRKRNASNSVKVLMICEQINETLQQREKVLVLLRLMEFVNEDGMVDENEFEFIKTVADTFNISQEEFRDAKSFVLDATNDEINPKNLLVIDCVDSGETDTARGQAHHIYRDHLDGRIDVLHVDSISSFVCIYHGHDQLYLNGHHIMPNRPYVLETGSIIKGSKIQPIYYTNVAACFLASTDKVKIIFTAKDVEFRFKGSTNGIQNFNFQEASGQLIGIMGGSGVGKSTLLNVLNGTLEPQSGYITINGHDLYKEPKALKGLIGFVPQDDLLIEELTVYQNLYYNAKLCFSNFTEDQICKAVDEILHDLDLYEARNLTVGNPLNKFISGGQRKRLNIGLELIREPSVLFVDEPTSGLSSMDSENVMLLLKEQTLKGKLVMINIHQPSSDIYKLFDKLIIMDKGGYPIYSGNPIDAVLYFKQMSNYVNAHESECPRCGNVNPEQILQIVEAKVVDENGKLTRKRKISPEEWSVSYKKKVEKKPEVGDVKGELPKSFFKIPNKFRQFKIFSIRNILSKLTNTQYMLINFLEAPLLAVILGYFTKYIAGTPDDPGAYVFSLNSNIPAYLFMCVVTALFVGMTVSAEEIIKDRRLLKREAFLNLSRFSYLNSKIFYLFVVSTIQMLSFILIGNAILGIDGMTWTYFIVLFSTAAFANMLGLNISAALNSVITIYILIPFILVPELLLSGVIVNFDRLHKDLASKENVPVVADIMTSRWAYEALIVEQFKGNEYHKHFFEHEQKRSIADFKASYLIPELKARLNTVNRSFTDSIDREKLSVDLHILQHEFSDFKATTAGLEYSYVSQLTVDEVSPEVVKQAKKDLETLKEYFTKEYREATKASDQTYKELVEDLGKEATEELKQNYHNEAVADIVLNKAEVEKIYETDNRLLQAKDPIYKYPVSKIGRAHFYSPVKNLFGLEIDTFWFNIGFIWFTSIILYIILLTDALRKLLTYLENLKFRKGRR